jgi:hypothetical protein
MNQYTFAMHPTIIYGAGSLSSLPHHLGERFRDDPWSRVLEP